MIIKANKLYLIIRNRLSINLKPPQNGVEGCKPISLSADSDCRKTATFTQMGFGAKPQARSQGRQPPIKPGTDAGRVCQKALSTDAYKWSNRVGARCTDHTRPQMQRCRAHQALHIVVFRTMRVNFKLFLFCVGIIKLVFSFFIFKRFDKRIICVILSSNIFIINVVSV